MNISFKSYSILCFFPFFFSACKWNNRVCKLCLHFEYGFTLYTESDYNTTNVRVLWQEPFEKLRSSSDDNDHLLTLDFHGEEGVMVKILRIWLLFVLVKTKFFFLFLLGIRFYDITKTVRLPFALILIIESDSLWSFEIRILYRFSRSFSSSSSSSLSSRIDFKSIFFSFISIRFYFSIDRSMF